MTHAQNDTFTDILQIMSESQERGKQDLSQVLEGYLSPLMKGMGYGLSNGWYTTAKAHKPGGFDLNAGFSVVTVPDADLFYMIGDLQEVNVLNPTEPVPTVFGPNAGPTFEHKVTNQQFEGLGGINMEGRVGFTAFPVPIAQIGIGLFKNTDLKFRFLPLNISDENISGRLWGVGILHDFKQYIPGIAALPFDMSAFVGYSSGNFERDVNGDGSKLTIFDINSLTAQALISKKLSILTLYGGVGYSRNGIGLQMKGSYDIDGNPLTPELEDPLDLNFNSGGIKATAGFRLTFAVITLHADYTLQEYSAITAGLGLTIR